MMERSIMTTWEVSDQIGTMTIANPPQNYLSEPSFVELERLREWTNDGDIRGIIITGEGRHFSAGGDLDRVRELAARESELFRAMSDGMDILRHIETVEVPVIAAIRGACFGAGLEIALACHIRVCSPGAIFAFPEINYGLVPGFGGASRLARTVTRSASVQMLLTGDVIDAARALEIGLVDHMASPRGALDFSTALMKKMVDGKPRAAVTSIVRAINNARTLDARAAMEEETQMFCRLAVASHE